MISLHVGGMAEKELKVRNAYCINEKGVYIYSLNNNAISMHRGRMG